VLVWPLENRVADASAVETDLGDLLTEWIASGLSRAGFDVVPTSFLSQQPTMVASGMVETAARAQAAFVVSGSLLRSGDSIIVFTEIVNGDDGSSLYSLGPATAGTTTPLEAAEIALDRIGGALAAELERPETARFQQAPPTLEAHRRMVEAERLFARELFDEAIPILMSAHDADSSYLRPLQMSAWAHYNRGRRAQSDSLATYLEARRDRLTPSERAGLSFLRALLNGDAQGQYIAGREMAQIDPNQWLFPVLGASRTNHLEEAREYAARFDPTLEWNRFEAYEWATYQSGAHHGLGRFEDELEIYRLASRLDPERYGLVSAQTAPLVALGRLDEVRELMDEFEDRPLVDERYDWDPGTAFRSVAIEARAHGHGELVTEAVSRALAYLESERGLAELQGPYPRRWREDYAVTLYMAGNFAEAAEIFGGLAAQTQGPSYVLSGLGVSLAAAGRTEEAEDILQRFAAIQPQTGNTLRRQARILAVLGRTDDAVAKISEAFRAGLYYGRWIHSDWDLHALRDRPTYRALTAPKVSN
jgi:tetratricopeptide (TPR) repeat protein